jgi:hypothetical protein
VGAGLLENAICQAALKYLIRRIREQARSHIGIAVYFAYQVAALVFGRLRVPLSTKRMVPNSPPESLPRRT